jgi:hypothetical protein
MQKPIELKRVGSLEERPATLGLAPSVVEKSEQSETWIHEHAGTLQMGGDCLPDNVGSQGECTELGVACQPGPPWP